MHIGGCGQGDEVGVAPHCDPADVVAAQRASTADRGSRQRLSHGHPHLAHCQGDAQRHRGGEGGARIAVGGQRHRSSGVEEPTGVRIGRPRPEFRARQQGGHGARIGKRPDVGVGQVRAVVCGCGAVGDGQRDPRPWTPFLEVLSKPYFSELPLL